jgi:hypothetical protein
MAKRLADGSLEILHGKHRRSRVRLETGELACLSCDESMRVERERTPAVLRVTA